MHPMPLSLDELWRRSARLLAMALGRLYPEARVAGWTALARPFRGFALDVTVARRLGPGDLFEISRQTERLVAADVALEPLPGESPPATPATAAACRHHDLIDVVELASAPPDVPIQRLRGIAWPSAAALRLDRARHDRALERDHLRLGQELGLFRCEPGGATSWLPRGRALHEILLAETRRHYVEAGYREGVPWTAISGGGEPLRSFEQQPTATAPGRRPAGLRGMVPAWRNAARVIAGGARLPVEIAGALRLMIAFHARLDLSWEAQLELPPSGPSTASEHLARALADCGVSPVTGRDGAVPTIRLVLPNAHDVFEEPSAYLTLEGREPVIHHSLNAGPEHTAAALLERNLGVFPFWLAPAQVQVVSISDDAEARRRAGVVHEQLVEAGYRSELDVTHERTVFKVRNADADHIPYVVLIKPGEADLRLRARHGTSEESLSVDDVLERLQRAAAIANRPAT